MVKYKVFKRDLKVSSEGAARTENGKSFHTLGATVLKDFGTDRVKGTTKNN